MATTFNKDYFFKKASEWMEDGDTITYENGVYSFKSGSTIILQYSEKNGYKQYYSKDSKKKK